MRKILYEHVYGIVCAFNRPVHACIRITLAILVCGCAYVRLSSYMCKQVETPVCGFAWIFFSNYMQAHKRYTFHFSLFCGWSFLCLVFYFEHYFMNGFALLLHNYYYLSICPFIYCQISFVLANPYHTYFSYYCYYSYWKQNICYNIFQFVHSHHYSSLPKCHLYKNKFSTFQGGKMQTTQHWIIGFKQTIWGAVCLAEDPFMHHDELQVLFNGEIEPRRFGKFVFQIKSMHHQ